jgi:amino acid adenylation domain-containing protein
MSDALKRRLTGLSADRIQALVSRLSTEGTAGPAPIERMQRRRGGRYPLSCAQERMWFLCQLAPDARVFNNPGALHCWSQEPLDLDRLRWSLNDVARRHEILRTTFHSDDGRPVQVVHDEPALTVDYVDIRALSRAVRDRETRRIAVEEGRRLFDLTTGPLLRLKIVHLDELEYVMLQTTHHMISDGWSVAMFSKELTASYDGGPAAALAPGELQYLDYVHWERRWLQSEQFKEQLSYWKRQLGEIGEPLELPHDRPRRASPSWRGGLETVTLPPSLTEALREFGRREHASVFQTLMAALVALLRRYTGEPVITVGTTTANRNRREFQSVMGPFTNTLAIRVPVDAELTFRVFVAEVRTLCEQALAHQEVPFERLIGELNPRRHVNAHPIFQVLLVHQNVPALYDVAGMRLEVMKFDYEIAKLDLNFWAEEIDGDLHLTLHYARDLFDPETARRTLAHLKGLLQAAVADPDRPIGSLDYFAAEAAPGKPTTGPTVGQADDPATAAEELFHRRFERAASRCGDWPAVEGPDESLTYRELNTAANRLARHLRRRGVRAQAPVGLLAPRTPRSVVAMLAILKAGGVYTPLDLSHPPARQQVLLDDAGARVLVTVGDEARMAAAELTGVEIVDLGQLAPTLARLETSDLGDQLPRHPLAYIIYTSGTTGRPKGVLVEHRNLVSYSDAVWAAMGLEPGHRFALMSSLSTDLGHTMIFPPLAHGGCVVMVGEEASLDAVALARLLGQRPVDCMKIAPSHLAALLESPRAGAFLPLRLLVLGGEACSAELVRRIRNHRPSGRILNHYGPTETTVGVLTYELPKDTDDPVPLGYPLAGASAYVLDAAGRPVPCGVAGELHIGGRGVARGYLNRPEQEAERFLLDPFRAGARVYRTGDLAKRRADGAIMFLGRRDRQVKLRGFRIELEEIEHALAAHPQVVQAVTVVDSAPDHAALSAYVQRARESPVTIEALHRHLAARLPAHMQPDTITFVDGFPLTRNGKVDYGALPRALPERPASTGVGPRDWVELELAHIWEDLLGVTQVGVTDNFFDLGGHSLLAVQLIARIDERFGQSLPLATLFEEGTIAGLAHGMRANRAADAPSPVVAIQRHGTGPPLVFAHPAGGNVLCYEPLSRALGEQFRFYGVQATATAAGVDSIGRLAQAYAPALRGAGLEHAPVLAGWSMGALVAFELATLLAAETGHHSAVVVLDQPAPGDLARAPGDGDPDDVHLLDVFATKVSDLIGNDLGVGASTLAGHDERTQAALLLERFKAYQLAPATTTVEDFRRFLDLMLAHNRLTAAYVPGVYPGRIAVLRAQPGGDERSPDLGWQRHCEQRVDVIPVPGSHVSMMRPPHVEIVAERLRKWINGAHDEKGGHPAT